MVNQLELIATEIECSKFKNGLVCVCYRPSNSDLNVWMNLFTSFLEFSLRYDRVVITGDINFPYLTWNSEHISSPDRNTGISFTWIFKARLHDRGKMARVR